MIGTRDPAGLPALPFHFIDALTYRLIAGTVRLEPLKILASQKVDWESWHVTFFVLGASHAVSLEHNDLILVELLTCLPPSAPSAPVLELPGSVPTERAVEAMGLRAEVQVLPFLLNGRVGLSGRFDPESHLVVYFPTAGAGQSARTEIGWTFLSQDLQVETVHTYPDAGRGVRTHTRFTRCSR